MRAKFLLFLLSLIFVGQTQAQYQGIYKVWVEPNNPNPCNNITVKLEGYDDYAVITSFSISDTIYNDTIDIEMYITVPLIGWPALTYFQRTHTIGSLPAGNYTIITDYKQSVAQPAPTIADTTFSVDSMAYAYAGGDSSYCDSSWVWLEGNTPPLGITGSWSVIQGNATLGTPGNPISRANNLSYGMNSFVWTVNGGTCSQTNSDTVSVYNAEPVSEPQTMDNQFVCADSTSIAAIKPTVGKGRWSRSLGGGIIQSPNDTMTVVTGLWSGNNRYKWEVRDTTGNCPSKSDNIMVRASYLNDTAMIHRSNDSLIAETAPRYQWLKDGVALPGDTNQYLLIIEDGTFSCMTMSAGCPEGPISNEIVVDDFVGINDNELESMRIAPNPFEDQLFIQSQMAAYTLRLYSAQGKMILQENASYNTVLNLSEIEIGIYFLQVDHQGSVQTKKILKQ